MTQPGISHDRASESLEAKARWFQALSLEERMDLLCSWTDLVLENQPNVASRRPVRSTSGRVQVLTRS